MTGRERAAARWIAAVAVLAAGWSQACAVPRHGVAPPWPGPPAQVGPDLQGVRVELYHFGFEGGVYDWGADADLEAAFRLRLEHSARYGQIVVDHAPAPRTEKDPSGKVWRVPEDRGLFNVPLAIEVTADETRRATGVLDALGAMSYSLFPFVPHWGDVSVHVIARLDLPEGTLPIETTVKAPYSMLTYAWFRHEPIEAAYARAYDRAFSVISERIARELSMRRAALVGRAPAPTALPTGRATGAAQVFPAIARLEAPLAALPPAQMFVPTPDEIILPQEGFGVITRPIGRAREDFLGRYLGALGGVEVARFSGGATVESRASTRNASDELVGSGRAEATGYRIALFRPPDRSGFFFPPIFGGLSQEITISGFEDDLPTISQRTGRADIPAIASDPATGSAVSLKEPISYDLHMKSLFLGQGVGLNLVIGDEDLQLFGTVAASVNLVEVRYMRVQIWESEVSGYSVVGLRSASISGQLGLAIPAWHVALRLAGQTDIYFGFDYPQPVEFQAATGYNFEKDVFERERAFVTGASLNTFSWQLSAVFLF